MRKVLSVILILLTLFVSACSSSKSIVGTWKSQSTVLGVVTETMYVFYEDGTGRQSGIIETPFEYVVDGDKVIITTKLIGISVSSKEYKFSIKGDTLTMISGSETMTLTRAE